MIKRHYLVKMRNVQTKEIAFFDLFGGVGKQIKAALFVRSAVGFVEKYKRSQYLN